MKILLVQVYLGRKEPIIYPIGLSKLSTVLKLEGHEVQGFDMNASKEPFKELTRIINNWKPDIVGFSLRNIDTTQYRDCYLYWRALEKCVHDTQNTLEKITIVVGGSGFSLFSRELMERIPGIDYGFYLESETSFPRLLENGVTPENVPGIYYRENNQIKFTGVPESMDSIQNIEPDRTLFPLSPYLEQPATIGIESKRGCRKRCAYCTYPFLSGYSIRLGDPREVVTEMEKWQKLHGVNSFHFVDTLFNSPSEHAKQICREIMRRKLKIMWIAWFNERLLDQELLELALESGCMEFAFSPDGIIPGTLRSLGKDLSPADIKKTYLWALKYPNMNVSYNFFISPPGDTLLGVLNLIMFAAKVKLRLGNRGRIFLGNIRIEPGTHILKVALQKGMLEDTIDLLPKTPAEMKKLFYVEPRTLYAHTVFNLVYKLKSTLKKETV